MVFLKEVPDNIDSWIRELKRIADEKKDGDAAKVPAVYKVKFETSCGDFVIEVNREWAPVGADRFYELVDMGFYNDCRFFRVVPNFMVQFGMSGDPSVQKAWNAYAIPDDPPAPWHAPHALANTGDTDLLFLAICTPRFEPGCYESLEDG